MVFDEGAGRSASGKAPPSGADEQCTRKESAVASVGGATATAAGPDVTPRTNAEWRAEAFAAAPGWAEELERRRGTNVPTWERCGDPASLPAGRREVPATPLG